jgi:hypothetical protein
VIELVASVVGTEEVYEVSFTGEGFAVQVTDLSQPLLERRDVGAASSLGQAIQVVGRDMDERASVPG